MHYRYEKNDVVFDVPLSGSQIYLVGTFTNWKKKDEYKFTVSGERLQLRLTRQAVNKIGNSGYIEYYFWDEERQQPILFNPAHPAGYCFNNQYNGSYNYLLLPDDISDVELNNIIRQSESSFRIKTTSSEFHSDSELANFREVQGGQLAKQTLFRSYHPVISSRSHHPQLKDIETERHYAAMQLLEANKVCTVINLSETSEELAAYLESASPSYYKTLWQEEQVVNVPVAYETVYFMSDRDESFNPDEQGFQTGIKTVIEHIANKPSPYHVHCRLGSDRTGVIIAFLQLFMGADKAQIESNYLQTNKLAIGEYRSFRLLEHALTQALGKGCFDNSHQVVTAYLLSLGLTREVIERAYQHLAGSERR
ncbi:tyrosine-protein phosphatase [Photobacterium sp. SDRW27]|uniref:tyrosine-protein phosphatase n=1 Tax=Photobacterium obscurum TaxID=2829490 RepID=UPI00224343DC|nr:tyrosine-protein phosphatase [Photobacterium obscurum]MCW8328631.1 tyrosine-protein phosphatase [Photobacterium obscurum]